VSEVSSIDSGSAATGATATPSATRRNDEWDARATWSRDERVAVTSAGPLPLEAGELLADADFIMSGVGGHLEPRSGFALATSPERCVAWNYAKRAHGSPTVYVFEAPPALPRASGPGLAAVPPALAAFVGSGAEPGILLVSATGEVRFWESVNHGLVEPQFQRFSSHQLPLGDDYAEHLWAIDDTTFVLTTTASTAWGISITNVGGRAVPTAAPFTRNSGLFARHSTAIFPASERSGIVAAAPAPGGVYLLGGNMLQKWGIGPDGNARLGQEYDLRKIVGPEMFDDPATWQKGNVHLELNDLVSIG
jgi:nuclear pore complex protein Nup133